MPRRTPYICMKATELLFDAGGPIVKKIVYNTPTEFALELLEVQYRIYTRYFMVICPATPVST